MSSKPSKTKLNPQMLIKETLYRTKKFLYNTFRNLKAILLEGYQKPPKNPTSNRIFAGSKKFSSKLQEQDNLYRSLSEKWDSNEVEKKLEGLIPPKEQAKGYEQCNSKGSVSVADCSGLKGLEEDKNASERKQEDFSFLAADDLAQKMKELEMMDVNDDMDHVLDVEEVLHYYSRLTCPAYVEIVDKFFMDMYIEYRLPKPSRSGSMRKMGSGSVHSSMRKMGSGSVHSSMRKLGSGSVHSSMRSLGPLKL